MDNNRAKRGFSNYAMKTLFASSSDVHELLPMKVCMDAMREALGTLAMGDAVLPLRQLVRQPDGKGILGMMPAYLGGTPSVIGIKVVTVFSGNHGTQFDSHQGAIQLFETVHGQLLAIIDAGSITAIRTAAVSGVATDLLARKNAHRLTILGSGTQARSHLKAMMVARSAIDDVRVWSRNYDKAVKFAQRESAVVQIEPIESAEQATKGADIICTTTAATAPVLMGDWISEGAHVNAVGASIPPFRELDSKAVVQSSFFVDRRQSAIEEADDFRIPKKEGLIDDSHIKGEIGEILIGKVHGRKAENEITVFKSLGLAIEDLAAANRVYRSAESKNVGTWVDFVASRHGE